ncbi:Aluminum-activated malate transporter 1, partial [Perkinsus olseni]
MRDIALRAAAASRLVREFLLYWEKGRTSPPSECGNLLAVEAYGFSEGVVTEGRELIPLPPCRIEWYTSCYLELDTTFLSTSSVEFMSGGVCEVTCLLILGLVITIITSQLTVSSAFEWTMKTVIASWYGAAFGCAIVAFVTAVNHNHYDPYIGVAVSIPFAIFVCLAEQANVTHCKLSAVYRGDKALLLIMIVVVFGGDAPYWAALTACIAYTTGTTITLLGTLILWCLHLLPRPGPPPMAWLGLCMSEYFEEISSVAPAGEIQQDELDQKWKRLDRAAAAAAETPDSHLRGIIFSMVSSLSTLAHAIKHASFSEAAVKQLWEPVDHSLNVIRVEVVCRLRPSPDTRVAKLDLYSLAISLRKKSTDALAAYTIGIESGDMRPISES